MDSKALLDAAVNTLKTHFPTARRYIEQIPQGFVRPCFFLKVQESERPLMNQRAERMLSLTVLRYAADGEDARTIALEVGGVLNVALARMHIDGRMRIPHKSQHAARDDGTLQWQAEYSQHVLKTTTATKMGTLKHNEHIKMTATAKQQ